MQYTGVDFSMFLFQSLLICVISFKVCIKRMKCWMSFSSESCSRLPPELRQSTEVAKEKLYCVMWNPKIGIAKCCNDLI